MIIFNSQDPMRQLLQNLTAQAIYYELNATYYAVKVTSNDDSVHRYSFSSSGTFDSVCQGIILLNPDAKLIELEGGHTVHAQN